MPEIELSIHAKDMLAERNILEEWVWRAINSPQKKKRQPDNTVHYTKPIKERGGRVLRVVVNINVQPNRVVTVFFDRRLGEKK